MHTRFRHMNYLINSVRCRVIDVAGQKSQRKKWIHFFDSVTAVIFFMSLSSYCEILEEEPTMVRLLQSTKFSCI